MLKIYKTGQGYYTRMVSGVAGMVMIAAGAMYIEKKLGTIKSEYTIYISWGVGIVVFFTLGLLLYNFVASKPGSCDFLIATEGEMKKVNWPTRREVIGSTWIVICAIFMMFVLLFASDMLFKWIGQQANIVP